MTDLTAASGRISNPTGELILFYSPGACSLASHIALEETGRPFRPVKTLLSENQHLTPEYLAINPRAKVPALIAPDGRVITENTAILTFIALTSPDAGLFPADILDQTLCISQMAWFSNTPHIFQRAKFRPYRFVERKEIYDDVRSKAVSSYWESMQEIDGLIAGNEWIMGDRYTVVDPYALVFYGWGRSNGLPMDTLKSFTRHHNQMRERAAVRAALEREDNPHFK
ncbi:glutathione S-transferase family protein [Neorhizobium sp. T25_13]|uniref:glutathione S-transferase family protein n=1 Tax=Neorhizobium sp. T25_13 TaxID=2093830 RepID=UPI000CF9ACDE|nr:glutathione S-transferase N-terminal domain-containing protein [Neorhizobium sp. T25_13]